MKRLSGQAARRSPPVYAQPQGPHRQPRCLVQLPCARGWWECRDSTQLPYNDISGGATQYVTRSTHYVRLRGPDILVERSSLFSHEVNFNLVLMFHDRSVELEVGLQHYMY